MSTSIKNTMQNTTRPRVVLKFGGTSVGDLDRIARVAKFVRNEVQRGYGVIVVVSAMSGETNRLVELVAQIGEGETGQEAPYHMEYDAVVASGEQVSAGLLALTLQKMGIAAHSWQGWQLPLRTDHMHSKARIVDIVPDKVRAAVDSGQVAIVAGFQGVTSDGRIATLGRGGSDTTAVALAATLDAVRCDIYTDVDGVYTTDPRITKAASRLDKVSYEEMLEMASLGARVLQTRSVELAMAYKVPVRVLSSFKDPDLYQGAVEQAGTIICDEDEIVEQQIVSGVTPSRAEAKISLMSVPNEPGRAAEIFKHLGAAGINVDMIVQSTAQSGTAANLSFTMNEAELAKAQKLLSSVQAEIGYKAVVAESDVAKVSVIGVGMKSHTGVAATMFETLAEKGINILNISTSEIKISVLIRSEYTELAVRALHSAYGIDQE